MYVPAHFAASDLAEIGAFVDRAGSADLVTFDGTGLAATLLPVLWDRPGAGGEAGGQGDASASAGHEPGNLGRLLGHLARANPQWRAAATGVPALAIVRGPQAYVSPSWYASTAEHGRTVPTWNYTTVHLSGPVRFHRDVDWLRDIVTRLTERYEAGREGRWWVTDAPEKFIAGQLRAIVGFEMTVQRVEAKDKLSQNRTPQDRANVIAALRAEPGPQAHEIAELMAVREAADGATAGREPAAGLREP
ncbi:MAG: FMN-binding negative transcriptional regulator [Streptosporangiaceae bacterium]